MAKFIEVRDVRAGANPEPLLIGINTIVEIMPSKVFPGAFIVYGYTLRDSITTLETYEEIRSKLAAYSLIA